VKVFGCIELLSAKFLYRRDKVFNGETYLDFLEQVARHYYPRPVFWIQDNASYHHDGRVLEWFTSNGSWWTVANLPPYSPELNAAEPLWHHTRITGTHNRYFAHEGELYQTLTRVFRSMQQRPDQIRGYLRPFL